jgi:hypothetical protein
MTRLQVTVIIGVALTYWVIALSIWGTQISSAQLAPFGSVVGAVTVTIAVFNRYLWHCPVFYGWLVNKPNIKGTWLVELRSDYVNPSTNEQIGPIRCFMVIRQSFGALSIRLVTKESKSESLTASITQNQDETYEVSAVYRNSPSPDFRHRSEIHHGALTLHTSKRKPSYIEGQYWTDRKTKGTLKLSSRSDELIDSYAEAESLFPLETQQA